MGLPSIIPPLVDLFVVLRAWTLLEGVQNANLYLTCVATSLTLLVFVQRFTFARRPPVPAKVLPMRPGLQLLFKPEDAAVLPSEKQENCMAAREACSLSGVKSRTNPKDSDANDKPIFGPRLTEPAVQGFSDLLPDSFAPLLSSSHMEILWNQLTPELVHALSFDASIQLRKGPHTIPLNKSLSRPQLVLGSNKASSRIYLSGKLGSIDLSNEDDFDMMRSPKHRSLTMVKGCSATLDPPLAMLNVASTLVHLPSLFEDHSLPGLRQVRIVYFVLTFICSISSLIERFLWIVERKCQIHLSKITASPIFKGSNDVPQWKLKLSFSGHALIFNMIKVPFHAISLPTFIIPAPHALLRNLISLQPLASARLRRENLSAERMLLAILDSVETWNATVKTVASPPSLSIDVTVPGGMTVAGEALLGRDLSAQTSRVDSEMCSLSEVSLPRNDVNDVHSVTSSNSASGCYSSLGDGRMASTTDIFTNFQDVQEPFDSNSMLPWSAEAKLNGLFAHDRINVNLARIHVSHQSLDGKGQSRKCCHATVSGSVVIWRADPNNLVLDRYESSIKANPQRPSHFSIPSPEVLESGDALPSLYSTLLFPDFVAPKSIRMKQLMQYDYSFDVEEESVIDAISVSVGISHPMLKGSTIVTTILESIYAYGSWTAREGAMLNPFSQTRKRNLLRHLPAIDLTIRVGSIFIPEESLSYHDDGQTKWIPRMQGGRMITRFVGGFSDDFESSVDQEVHSSLTNYLHRATEGIKVIADFDVNFFCLNSESHVHEFPELEIYDGSKLISVISGTCSGRLLSHLRPQILKLAEKTCAQPTSTGPNISNPLEAYEVEFSTSSLSVKIREWTSTLGHRRLIIPSETTVFLRVLDSVVDMSFEGKSRCECSWDFQGLSPILQVTRIGYSPAHAEHENKRQMPLLISDLRQGRLNFNVSQVGGITITQAATSRENRKGLYDWKFFNALVSPNEESAERLIQVLHDKRTMGKLLQVVGLIHREMGEALRYILTQVWRAKEIFDEEGVTDPGHAIPGHKMARLLSLFLCGNPGRTSDILPIIHRVIAGDGLDVAKVKELLREYLAMYDEWASEFDRLVRWAEVLVSPMTAQFPFVEQVPPLCELPQYCNRFNGIPSAKEIYQEINRESHMTLDPSFSTIVARVAPYMSFRQVEYLLRSRPRPRDWQADDLRRLRYVYSVKKKVHDISESYGGMSFLPQSFFVSVFLGEATRASLRAREPHHTHYVASRDTKFCSHWPNKINRRSSGRASTLSTLRKRRMAADVLPEKISSCAPVHGKEDVMMSPAGRVASQINLRHASDRDLLNILSSSGEVDSSANLFRLDSYCLGDSLLGPQDVAILLQAGLASAMKSSTVVQLNQRMLLDLTASQPADFAVAVLAELGKHGGHGSARGLASALMSLLELDQSSFTKSHRLNMHKLLETWLPGIKMPARDDYLAGGRWARQSYYEAIFSVAKNILDDAESYMALKGHVQRVSNRNESDPIPRGKEIALAEEKAKGSAVQVDEGEGEKVGSSKLFAAIEAAKEKISHADSEGRNILPKIMESALNARSTERLAVVDRYQVAFVACSAVLSMDKLSFQANWFKSFYRRNYDAFMVKSLYDNVVDDVDEVRVWLDALRSGSQRAKVSLKNHALHQNSQRMATARSSPLLHAVSSSTSSPICLPEHHALVQAQFEETEDWFIEKECGSASSFFSNAESRGEQELVDAIIDCVFFDEVERDFIRKDPLVRLLISNPPGKYNFTIILAMGVITEGERGLELDLSLKRLLEVRGVESIRSDTGTARSFEFNASRIENAVRSAWRGGKPFGFLGYSQGCANALMAESLLLTGPPDQNEMLKSPTAGLVARQLLFSAANGSIHGPAGDSKMQKLIVLCEQAFKYQQGYFSRAFISATLEALNGLLDSAGFHKFTGGAHTFLPEGSRAFWREAQHLPTVPTTVMRGVMEKHTTPESLEMLGNLLTKQSGSALHDSQVHVFDAVGHPNYIKNRNYDLLKACDMGGAIQRTHHWSPLEKEVQMLRTRRDIIQASFQCAKDRHVFPWVDVNVRFGFIKYIEQ